MKTGTHGIGLDPNDWEDCEWWFEDEPEVFEFMRNNEDIIRFYAEKNGMTIKKAIDYLFKNKIENKKE